MSGKTAPSPRTPPSPCVRNCCLDESGVCMGCFRTIDEICAWHEAPVSEKHAILERCEARRAARAERLRRLTP